METIITKEQIEKYALTPKMIASAKSYERSFPAWLKMRWRTDAVDNLAKLHGIKRRDYQTKYDRTTRLKEIKTLTSQYVEADGSPIWKHKLNERKLGCKMNSETGITYTEVLIREASTRVNILRQGETIIVAEHDYTYKAKKVQEMEELCKEFIEENGEIVRCQISGLTFDRSGLNKLLEPKVMYKDEIRGHVSDNILIVVKGIKDLRNSASEEEVREFIDLVKIVLEL